MSVIPEYTVAFGSVRGREIEVEAGAPGIWTFSFVCGSRPIAPGGTVELFCEFPKFWLATILQDRTPEKPGYVSVEGSSGLDCNLAEYARFWKHLSWARISLPDGMRQGEAIHVRFGSEEFPCYAIANKYKYAAISWRVDHADFPVEETRTESQHIVTKYESPGTTFPIWPPMVIRIVPGAPAKLSVVVPSVVGTGGDFTVKGRVEDSNSNIGARLDGPIVLQLTDEAGEAAAAPRTVHAGATGTFVSEGWSPPGTGVFRIRATAPELPPALSNAVLAQESASERIAWGDCHCHSHWSDGVATLESNLEYARDESFLDVFGFTEHLTNRPEARAHMVDKYGADWATLGCVVAELLERTYDPGSFVTIPGYEYSPEIKTKNPTGDHCVYSPSGRWEDMPFASELTDLVPLAKERGCLVIPHVGGLTPKWDQISIDPDVTTVVEIASMHGHFECYAQEALHKGHKLGFVGMSDGHFGMPGYDIWAQHGRTRKLEHRNYGVQSAITGFVVSSFTREQVLGAMRSRRTYATTGQRVLLRFGINGEPMGSELTTTDKPRLNIDVNATAPIAVIDIIRGDRRVHRITDGLGLDAAIEWVDPQPVAGETWYYVRVRQVDFSIAWSSPVWVTYEGEREEPQAQTDLPAWNAPPYWPFDAHEPADPAHTERLKSILSKREIPDRFVNFKQIGVFSEPRGRFALFHAEDHQFDDTPVHVHLYIDFPDDRLYIAEGFSDYGVTLK